MATTPNYALRYPLGTDTPNGALQIQNLATDVDTVIKNHQSVVIAKPAQTGFGSLGSGSTATIASVTIPDPGYQFHIETEAMVDFGSNTSGAALQLSVNVDSAVFNTNAITEGHGTTFVGVQATDVNADCPYASSKNITPGGYSGGSHVLYLVAKATAALFIYSGPVGSNGDPYQWYIKLVPVA